MQVEIVKRTDGAGVLRCTRDDGSVSWQKQTDRHAAFIALHDLTHFAVESTLGYSRGFFGLVSEGWDIVDTSGKGARGPLPGEAVEVESLVGLFFTERARGLWTANDFNEALATHLAAMRNRYGQVTPRVFSEEQLADVRKRREELFQEWAAVPTGQTLKLMFENAVSSNVS